jgi:curved DNA-binding protein CbpA
MSDPFSTLGVGEDADDDQIKQRYLSRVRLFRRTVSQSSSGLSGRL